MIKFPTMHFKFLAEIIENLNSKFLFEVCYVKPLMLLKFTISLLLNHFSLCYKLLNLTCWPFLFMVSVQYCKFCGKLAMKNTVEE